ncbi:MAG: hypothetical protein F6K21_05665 [Symploca sp. SIO2D2]|nr:hypothetical protein [Symploca sp. SIO2D2]
MVVFQEFRQKEDDVKKLLRKSSLLSFLLVITGGVLLIPAFSMKGTRFDYQLFCFYPPQWNEFQNGVDLLKQSCTDEVKRGLAWRVAIEAEKNNKFKANTYFLKLEKAQRPLAGAIGLLSASFIGGGMAC